MEKGDINYRIKETVNMLLQIEKDISVPKNIREKIKTAILALQESNKNTKVMVNKSLQELDDISDDPNVPIYTRTQIWNVVSILETL